MEIEKIFENVSPELLTEEAKSKISTLIEAKISEAVNSKVEELESLFENYKENEIEKLEEKAVEYVDEHLIDKIDEYFDYVAEEYMKENELAIEDGIKASMYEKIVESMKNVMSENQITEKDIVENESAIKEAKELKEELNRVIKENLDYKRKVKKQEILSVFEEITEGLSFSEKENIKKLSADFDVDDVDSFREKVEIIKESIFSDSSSDTITENNSDDLGGNFIHENSNEIFTIQERDANAVWDDFEGMNKYL